MSRPIPTPVMHFTHVDNLPAIVANGLLSDADAQGSGLLQVEVGERGIKEARRRRLVDVGPGGCVADYAPFYFAPYNAMMDSISHGRVEQYQDGCEPLVYLVSTVERLRAAGCALVVTDRNARLQVADFQEVIDDTWGGHIDWPLMQAQWWNNTPDEPDRRERRMAECLVHGGVAWDVFVEVVTLTPNMQGRARQAIAAAGGSTPVTVRPSWYTYGAWDLR